MDARRFDRATRALAAEVSRRGLVKGLAVGALTLLARPAAAASQSDCLFGDVECFGKCVDTSSDPYNCGGCGNACGFGIDCVFGACGVGGCAFSQQECFGYCSDVSSDPNNCGICGNQCDSGTTCRQGACACSGSGETLCPGAGDPNGTLGNEPLGYVTICRITGNVANPLAPVTVRVDQLEAYLAQAGTIMPAPTAGCPRAGTGGGGGGGGNQPPTTTPPGSTTSVSVSTTPNTVVTARGAGVDQAARSNKAGKARLKITPKKAGIVTVRATAGRVVKRIGVAKPTRSGLNLTG